MTLKMSPSGVIEDAVPGKWPMFDLAHERGDKLLVARNALFVAEQYMSGRRDDRAYVLRLIRKILKRR